MLSRMPIRLGAALLLTSAMLQSCAHVPERSASVSSNDVVTIESPEMGDLSRGDIVELKDGVLASFGEVRIGREYFSASGRLCKEILNATGRRVVSIACLFDDQNWYTRRPLSVRSSGLPVSEATFTPAQLDQPATLFEKGNDESAVASGDDSKRYQLLENETLWSFSKRTTGNALNWKAIALYNNIENADTVDAGDELAVPVSLSLSGQ